MNIQIKMHSELDCPLKPDMVLIKKALEEMSELPGYDKEKLGQLGEKIAEYEGSCFVEKDFAKQIKSATTEEEREKFKQYKKEIAEKVDKLLEECLDIIMSMDKDMYHYSYDNYFNQIIAGLMGSTCYMKEAFEDLQNKRVSSIRAIAKVVEENGHHSTFGHAHQTLEITGIPKMLAMILNNEKEYNTSEKSARYTVMDNLSGKEAELYYKWKDIFAREIRLRYGKKQPFFDEKGTKIEKLAQENARYMLSVFIPTNMVYTTSFRQLNYIAHWFEDVINSNNPNPIYAKLIPEMKEFVQWMKDNGLYNENLSDGKQRKLSIFGAPLLKQVITSDVYALASRQSFACLAQAQRHRTLAYHISEEEFKLDNREIEKLIEKIKTSIMINQDFELTEDELKQLSTLFYIPPILQDKKLQKAYLKDILSVAGNYPQGRLLPVVERGETENFLLKAKERVCVLAQKEIRDLTQSQCKQFARELENEAGETRAMAYSGKVPFTACVEKGRQIEEMQKQFQKMSLTARCSAGYNCKNPCQFGEGIGLQSLV